MLACVDLNAEVFATLPASLHYRGEPNEWVRVTRPGQKLHSFLEGPVYDADGGLWCVDVPYGRIFCIDRSGQWTLAHEGDGQPHGLARLPDGAFAVADYRHGPTRSIPRGSVVSTAGSVVPSAFAGWATSRVRGTATSGSPIRAQQLVDPSGRLF